MKYLWYLSCILTIMFVLINNPRSSTLASMRNAENYMNFTRSAKNNLQLVTILSMVFFFVLTILTNIYSVF